MLCIYFGPRGGLNFFLPSFLEYLLQTYVSSVTEHPVKQTIGRHLKQYLDWGDVINGLGMLFKKVLQILRRCQISRRRIRSDACNRFSDTCFFKFQLLLDYLFFPKLPKQGCLIIVYLRDFFLHHRKFWENNHRWNSDRWAACTWRHGSNVPFFFDIKVIAIGYVVTIC